MNTEKLEDMIEHFESALESRYKSYYFEEFKSFLYKNPYEVENYMLTPNFVKTLNILKEMGKFEEEIYTKKSGRNIYKPIESLKFNIFSNSYGTSLESSFTNDGFQVVDCENEDSLSENEVENYLLTPNFVKTLNILKQLGKFEEEIYTKRSGRNIYKPIESLKFNIFSSSYGISLESNFITAEFQVVDCENEDNLSENEVENMCYDAEIDYGDYDGSHIPLDFSHMSENRRFE
jgi:hypothetical protein